MKHEIFFLCVIPTQIESQTVPFNVSLSRTSFSHFVEGKLKWAHLDIKAIYRIMSCTAVRIGFFSARIDNEERIKNFYVNKSNEEPRQVFRSKEIIQNSQKVLFFCMIIKLD